MKNGLRVVVLWVVWWWIVFSAQANAQVVQAWIAFYDGPDNRNDEPQAMVVDSTGNVYVTGHSWSDSPRLGYDYATIKYNSNGNQLWVARYNGPANGNDGAYAMALDNAGNIYVTGYSEGSGTFRDYATIKYDSNGNQLWVARYNGPATYPDDYAYAMAVSSDGNIYVTWESAGGTQSDYATIKYDSNGNQLWVARYNGPGNRNDEARAIALDSAGNIYVTGHSVGSGTFKDYATIKYDSNGNQLWVARYNGPGNRNDYVQAITLDSAGNVYVTGYSVGSGTYYDYTTIKYDSSGNQLWVVNNGGSDIALDSAGNIYVTGNTTIKYDSNGNQLWVNNGGSDIALDSAGNIYVSGYSGTIKYDSNGNQLWVLRNEFAGSDIAVGRAFALDSAGNIYVTGRRFVSSYGDRTYLGTGYIYDYVTIKYSPPVRIIINKTIANRGDTIHWDLSLNGSGKVDGYLGIVFPSGDFVCLLDPGGNNAGLNNPAPIVTDWSVISGTFRLMAYTFTGDEPKGTYQLFVILTTPASDPLDKNNWLAYDFALFTVR